MRKRLQSPGESFHGDILPERNPASSNRNGRIPLHDRHRRYRLRDNAACSNDGAIANNNVGKDDCSWAYESFALDSDASKLLEMSDNRRSHANGCAVLDRDEVGSCSIQQDVVANPDPFPNLHTSRPMHHRAERSRTGRNSGEQLEGAAEQSAKCALVRLFPITGDSLLFVHTRFAIHFINPLCFGPTRVQLLSPEKRA